MKIFADNLKNRAVELGISSAEAARRAGLSERRYGNYVSGRREPDLATLLKIAEVLESSPNILLGFEKVGKGEVVRDKINSAVSALDAKDREVVAACAEAVVNLRRK